MGCGRVHTTSLTPIEGPPCSVDLLSRGLEIPERCGANSTSVPAAPFVGSILERLLHPELPATFASPHMASFSHAAPSEDALMKKLHSEGMGIKKVAKLLGRGANTVSKHVFKRHTRFEKKPVGGHASSTRLVWTTVSRPMPRCSRLRKGHKRSR